MDLSSIPPSTTQFGLQITPDGAMSQITWDAAEGGLGAWQAAVGEDAELIPLPSLSLAMIASQGGADADGSREQANPYATSLLRDERWQAGWCDGTDIVGAVLVISNRVTCDGDAIGLQLGHIAALRQYVARKRQALAIA